MDFGPMDFGPMDFGPMDFGPMDFGRMPGDGESQISHGKWMVEMIRRIRLCWDELLINPAQRKTERRFSHRSRRARSDAKGVTGQIRQVDGGSDTI